MVKTLKLPILAALLAMCAAGCSDETWAPEGDAALTVTLAIPQSAPSVQQSSNGRSTSAPTASECQINDLRLIAFPQNAKGTLINEPMTLPPDASTSHTIRINNINPGDYRIFIVANMGSKVAAVKTETQLREIIINYGDANNPQLPQPGNLPMIYEPQEVTSIAGKPVQLSASLSFSCVKVALNVIFDKEANPGAAAAYGSNGLRITAVSAHNVSASTTLVGQSKVVESAFSTPLSLGQHFTSWTRDQSAADSNDADVMGAFQGSVTPSDPTAKWCYHQVIYLPERYVTQQDRMTRLELDGEVFNNMGPVATNKFGIDLGHDEGNTRVLPRDTYYEVIATVNSLGMINLDAALVVKSWSTVAVDASIRHTLLSVDKTRVSVSSLVPDVVNYSSSASLVEFECSAPYIQDKPVIVAQHDAANHRFTLCVNPGIAIASLSPQQQKGSVKVKLKANNIVKFIDVDYDIQPFFSVDYTDHTIVWGEADTKVAQVTTNLGSVRFPWATPHTITSGSANLKISQEMVSEGVYNIKMQQTSDPKTTTTITFNVGPESNTYYSQFVTPINVTLKPQPDKYRIYMRAINDRFNGGVPGDGSLLTPLAENDIPGASSSSNNWNDGWSDNYQMNGNRHRIYVYYQYGESGGTDQIPQENVWYFNRDLSSIATTAWNDLPLINFDKTGSPFPGNEMYGDSQNPGWYYFDFPHNAMGKNKHGKPDHMIKPGETLLIFSNYWDEDKGYTRHRFSHHMDPGITLFNFEDFEGWYLYDPTCDPYYRIYDEKPVIQNVVYTVYTKGAVTRWEHQYGVAGENVSDRYTITSASGSISSSAVNSNWYRTTFTLKAPKGEYEKAIKLVINGASVKPVLFGGNSWTEGYFDGSRWYKGKPAGI